jgi:uncharacterized protein YqfA (UPF0365 family)
MNEYANDWAQMGMMRERIEELETVVREMYRSYQALALSRAMNSGDGWRKDYNNMMNYDGPTMARRVLPELAVV